MKIVYTQIMNGMKEYISMGVTNVLNIVNGRMEYIIDQLDLTISRRDDNE